MPTKSICIPQMGEGLREARIVALLKQPGELVKRDEPIYQMETDKAIMDVESPYEGTLKEWVAKIDDILPIGAEIAKMETTDEENTFDTSSPQLNTDTTSISRRTDIPPRTRAYAKSLGITDETLEHIPAQSSKLMPEDIDVWQSLQKPGHTHPFYTDQSQSQKQKLLSSRLSRAVQLVVPGTIHVVCSWENLEKTHTHLKTKDSFKKVSIFTLFAYCVAQVIKDHPALRSTLVGDNILRIYNHLQMGIAVSLPQDELVLAVIKDSDTLDWPTFAKQMRVQIEAAREGKDQASESVTLSITNMQNFGIRDGVPVVVPPAAGTLFLGEVYIASIYTENEVKTQRCVNLSLTIDHRILNGVGAAQFINALKHQVENCNQLFSSL